MRVGFASSAPEVPDGAHSEFFVRATASVLGLCEYPSVPSEIGAITPTANEPVDFASEGSLLYLVSPAPRLPARSRSASRGGFASVAAHAAVALLVVSLAVWSRPPTSTTSSRPDRTQMTRVVFLVRPGPGGGGGGGGNKQSRPASRARAIGHAARTVPVARRAEPPTLRNEETPIQPQMLLEAQPLAADTMLMTGLPDAPPSLPFSRGPGSGEGVGNGTGSGIGSGVGPGVGPGSGGGFGGGAYRIGSGIVPPTLLRQVTPRYTGDAMRQRIQGTVTLEVVISREGIPTAIRVIRSLDRGLDEEAIAAARQWRFAPGRIGDTPVDVLVTILLEFNIR